MPEVWVKFGGTCPADTFASNVIYFLFYLQRVFSSKSPLMVVTLETRVQRELQTDSSVFNRYLNNARLRIQQLPVFATTGLPWLPQEKEVHKKKKTKTISCLYGIQGIAFIFYLIFFIPEITLYIWNLNIKIPARHHIFILLHIYMAFSPFKWFPQLFPAAKAEVELRPLKKQINKCLKIPMDMKIIDYTRSKSYIKTKFTWFPFCLNKFLRSASSNAEYLLKILFSKKLQHLFWAVL